MVSSSPSSNDFKIKFDGQQPQVDASVLISSLIHTTTVVQEINSSLNSGKKIEIKVKALEPGSFLIHIELVEKGIDSLRNLLTKENVVVGATIIGAIVDLIAIKKHLRGKKPKKTETKGDTTTIVNRDGNLLIINNATFNIYEHNPRVQDALSQNFDALNGDPAITGFEITDKDEKPFVRVDRDDFADLALKSEIESEGDRQIVEAATLNIVRLSFEDNLKWDFYYRGIKISAKIADPSFYEQIDKGEAFAKGDTLEVELQINQRFDDSVNTYITRSYQVNKILRHIARGQEPTFEFEGE